MLTSSIKRGGGFTSFPPMFFSCNIHFPPGSYSRPKNAPSLIVAGCASATLFVHTALDRRRFLFKRLPRKHPHLAQTVAPSSQSGAQSTNSEPALLLIAISIPLLGNMPVRVLLQLAVQAAFYIRPV